ncbi:TPA: baseplate J/gp47 family protein [Burkholderia vietnamiensis]|uniref:baseplate J/gp47 family protein n=1 Tax=Burkholderia cepacia complex TaxID=87882 RepID=UPI001594C5A0|nr:MULTISPECIES: baseplate J/gp47 family protein [Burkholderia cepacia complex]MCA8156172.1 baseplate J/gp47 family protein [Burkholderia contaminans]MCA8207986.1 baseplate J/gp47 family protein [Burkholderia vietnamiensis]HDR9098360.1 baseplate J/gp47 family protein [Burkholderia vietnamiensis]HDR9116995.1 baseplate J/gp47 family protein [Burkholderia vietnamiensis]HDR9166304.1 baseplate J/gp47 family protein [Burkholderia vietnamiensis]
MTTSALIDLSSLPLPDALEVLDFETIYATRKAAMVSLWPADEQAEIAATLELESEPLARLLQENSYRELVWRQRVNDAVRAVMLAFAMGNDLEQRAALFGLMRLTVTPADPANNVDAVMERDDSLRERIQLAPQGFSVAGPSAAYITKARAVDGRIIDAQTSRPRPGDVLVSLLSSEGDGTASDDLCRAVEVALSAEDQRPLNDTVFVKSAEIVRYRIHAKCYTRTAVGADVLIAQAKKNAQAYADKVHRIGIGVAESAIKGVCQAAGLSRTELIEPVGDIAIERTQASYCVEVVIEYGGLYA